MYKYINNTQALTHLFIRITQKQIILFLGNLAAGAVGRGG